MEKLIIQKSQNTPEAVFDPETGKFSFTGRSIPENPGEFYDPIILWLSQYFESPAPITTFDINLDYVNSGSSKYLLGLLRLFKKFHQKGIDVEINWFFEEDDEAIEGLGHHYQSILQVPFNMKEYI